MYLSVDAVLLCLTLESLALLVCSMEGRWNGELATIPAGDEGTQVCSYDLIFRDDEGEVLLHYGRADDPVKPPLTLFVVLPGVWSQRQSRTTINGLTLTQHFWIKPVADGILKVRLCVLSRAARLTQCACEMSGANPLEPIDLHTGRDG